MKKNTIVHFIILIFILVIGIYSFLTARGDKGTQLMIGTVTSVAYVCWGIFHHLVGGTIHKKVVVEYILIGTIAILILFTILAL